MSTLTHLSQSLETRSQSTENSFFISINHFQCSVVLELLRNDDLLQVRFIKIKNISDILISSHIKSAQGILHPKCGKILFRLYSSRSLLRTLCLHHFPWRLVRWFPVLPTLDRDSCAAQVGQVESSILDERVQGLPEIDFLRSEYDDLHRIRIVLLFLVSVFSVSGPLLIN